MNQKHTNFASRQVDVTTAFLNAFQDLLELRYEWDAQGFANAITDEDLQGDLSHIVAADLAAGFTSVEAVRALLAQGHNTNLYKLVR